MQSIHRQALVAHSAQKMFDLINDVSSYPLFLKWCVDSHVLDSNDKHMIAGLSVKVAGIKQRFTTQNTFTMTDDLLCIELSLIDGPFDHLHGEWVISYLAEEVSKVELHLNFNFKTGIMNSAFRRGFGKIAQQLVSDFVRRADEI